MVAIRAVAIPNIAPCVARIWDGTVSTWCLSEYRRATASRNSGSPVLWMYAWFFRSWRASIVASMTCGGDGKLGWPTSRRITRSFGKDSCNSQARAIIFRIPDPSCQPKRHSPDMSSGEPQRIDHSGTLPGHGKELFDRFADDLTILVKAEKGLEGVQVGRTVWCSGTILR
eukprot:m.255750 g.255750  ORF g.255750 m.255750 type:complete len:171 (-) comp15948_c0_seq5:6070-6582(-)